jgi:integrating conjugative element protein (TIGR03757 family)
MTRPMRSIFCISVSLLMSPAFSSTPQVFGLQGMEFTHLNGIVPCVLDSGDVALKKIKETAQSDPSIQPERLSSQFSSELNTIGEAQICRYNAKSLGIEKLPAIVFDHNFVVYGEPDLRKAQIAYERYQRRQGSSA